MAPGAYALSRVADEVTNHIGPLLTRKEDASGIFGGWLLDDAATSTFDDRSRSRSARCAFDEDGFRASYPADIAAADRGVERLVVKVGRRGVLVRGLVFHGGLLPGGCNAAPTITKQCRI